MKPKKSPHKDRQRALFRAELVRIIDPRHGLVKLSRVVDWDRLDELFGSTYCPDNGRPGVSTRLMVALHYLKYTYNLSDKDVYDPLAQAYWPGRSRTTFKRNDLSMVVCWFSVN